MVSLENALVAIRSREEAAAFLRAAFSPHEVHIFRRRWRAFELFAKGATQRSVAKQLHISTTTATRAAHAALANRRIIESIMSRLGNRAEK
jgi:uncharacterized protein YerC